MFLFCAFTSVCEEDAHWVPQYLEEMERLGMRFAIHLDRCSKRTKKTFLEHPLCVGYTKNDRPHIGFDERHRAGVFCLCQEVGAKWAVNMDIDETLETEAQSKLTEIAGLDVDKIGVTRFDLWEHPSYYRADGCIGKRDKILNLSNGLTYRFTSGIVNGPSARKSKVIVYDSDLVFLHWGHLTNEMRIKSKQRWDEIYTSIVGRQPYDSWELLVDTDNLRVEKHDYLKHLGY